MLRLMRKFRNRCSFNRYIPEETLVAIESILDIDRFGTGCKSQNFTCRRFDRAFYVAKLFAMPDR